ncbi:MFS transporter [Streptomyces sp. NPDC005551]|uniref:MFS transporter n=1 Tax=Streptomyces sp. NPDC005551 TaxID=3364725 RepID=UPI0036B3E828
MLGDNIYYLALSWAAVQAGTPAQAGLVTAASAVPRALLMLGGGVVADRFGPRKVVIGSDAVRCAAVLAVAALLFAAEPGLWPLALLALVFGTVDAVFMPAVGALPARITGRGQLARVQGMRGLAIRFANVVGAPLGGLGVAAGGAAAAFGLAGLLIAVSVPLLVSVRMTDPPPHPADGPATAAGTGPVDGDGPADAPAVSAGPGPAAAAGVAVPAEQGSTAEAAPVGRAAAAPAGHGPAAGAAAPAGPEPRAGAEPVDGAGRVDASAAKAGTGGTDSAVVSAGAGPLAGAEPPTASAVPAGAESPVGVAGAAGDRVVDGARPSSPNAWRELRDGLRYIRRHPVLAPLILAVALGDLGFVGPLNVGLALLADQRGWGAAGMGWVLAGFGTGAGLVSLLLTARGRLPYAGRVMAVALLLGCVAMGSLAHLPGVAAATGAALLVGLLAGLSGVLCGALLQTETDPAYLGRVSAVAGIVSLGFAPLSMPLSATAIGVWGTGPVFVVSAAVCGLGGVVALCSGPLRRAELPK